MLRCVICPREACSYVFCQNASLRAHCSEFLGELGFFKSWAVCSIAASQDSSENCIYMHHPATFVQQISNTSLRQLHISDGNARGPSLLACYRLSAKKPVLCCSQQPVFDMCQCAGNRFLTCSRFENAVYL